MQPWLSPAGAGWRGLALLAVFFVTSAALTRGGLADSVLGATLQARFRCARCGEVREEARCPRGGPVAGASGLAWLTNDAVNGACTLVGAAVGAAPVVLRAAGLA